MQRDPLKLDYAPPPKPIPLGPAVIAVTLFGPATIGAFIGTLRGIIRGSASPLMDVVGAAITTLLFLIAKAGVEILVKALRNPPR